jgi:hypothetical protein
MARLLITAGNGEVIEGAVPVGVGLVDSSIGLAKLLSSPEGRGVTEIFFLGTIGSYGRLKPLQLVKSRRGVQIEPSHLFHNSYTPIDLKIEGGEGVWINSSNYITTSPMVARRFLQMGIEGESMEFYALLRTAQLFDLPLTGIFVVTNYTSPTAHLQYRRNLPIALQKLREVARRLLL